MLLNSLLTSVIGAILFAALLVPAGARLLMQLAVLIAEALRRHANATEQAYRGYRNGWRLEYDSIEGGGAERRGQ